MVERRTNKTGHEKKIEEDEYKALQKVGVKIR